MANTVYTSAKSALMNAALNLPADTIKVVLIDAADYVFSAAHSFLSDVPALARVATGTLANKTVTAGVFDADDTVLTAVTGDQFEAVILYKDTGVEATSQLIAYIDTGTGFPLTPNGGNITVQWSNAAGKILSL